MELTIICLIITASSVMASKDYVERHQTLNITEYKEVIEKSETACSSRLSYMKQHMGKRARVVNLTGPLVSPNFIIHTLLCVIANTYKKWFSPKVKFCEKVRNALVIFQKLFRRTVFHLIMISLNHDSWWALRSFSINHEKYL